jgi:hypothetical protein
MFKIANLRLAAVLVLLFSVQVKADILFEGFTKVVLAGKHVGYVVQRYEFDPKKKEFQVRHFFHAEGSGISIKESLVARANAGFVPISYQFTEQNGDKLKMIDVAFKGQKMTGTIHSGNAAKGGAKPKLAKEIISKEIPKGAFLASFLYYMMLSGKDGIKTGVKYDYAAIAEEEAAVMSGSAYVSKEEKMNEILTFKVLNKFKNAEYISYVTGKAETILTKNATQAIETTLVASLEEAAKGMSVNTSSLKSVFGDMPKGLENSIAKNSVSQAGMNRNGGFVVDPDLKNKIEEAIKEKAPEKISGKLPVKNVEIAPDNKPKTKQEDIKSPQPAAPKAETPPSK